MPSQDGMALESCRSAIGAAAPVLRRAAASGEKSLAPTVKAPMEPIGLQSKSTSLHKGHLQEEQLCMLVSLKRKTRRKIFCKMLFKRTKNIYILLILSKTSTLS